MFSSVRLGVANVLESVEVCVCPCVRVCVCVCEGVHPLIARVSG